MDYSNFETSMNYTFHVTYCPYDHEGLLKVFFYTLDINKFNCTDFNGKYMAYLLDKNLKFDKIQTRSNFQY